jgi:hypothetical protein
MIGFLIGFLIGGLIGVGGTCIVAARKIRNYEQLLEQVRRALNAEEEV